MQNNRIHDMYREGGKEAKMFSAKDLLNPFIEVDIEITNFSIPFEFVCSFPVNTKHGKVLTLREIAALRPEFRYNYGSDGSKKRYSTLNDCIGYRFFDRPAFGTSDHEILKGEKRNFSRDYYFGNRATPKLIEIACEDYRKREHERVANIPNLWSGFYKSLDEALKYMKENLLYSLKHPNEGKILVMNRFERFLNVQANSILLPFETGRE